MKAKLHFLTINFFFFAVLSICQIRNSEEYQKGITALSNNQFREAKNLFKESFNKNRDAGSAYQIAQILLKEEDFQSRNDALEYFKEAALRMPENLEYRIGYAQLLEQFAINSALHEYENILKVFPGNAAALARLGYYYLSDYNNYKNSSRAILGAGSGFSFADENMDDYQKAEKYFLGAIENDSLNTDAFLGLCRLYENSGNDNKAISFLSKITKYAPTNKDAHLFLGMIYNRNGKIKKAGEEFQKTLDLMNIEERDDFVYNSVKLLLGSIIDLNNRTYSREKTEELISKFWKIANPLKIAEDNQRLLEHYSRMAYANLHFSVPNLKVIGWKTNRGEVLIRYGQPRYMNKIIVTDFKEKANGDPRFKNEIDRGRKINWVYDNFILQFESRFNTGDYKLEPEYSADFFERYKKKVIQAYSPKGKRFYVNNEIYNFKSQDEKSKEKLNSYLVFDLPLYDSLGQVEKEVSYYDYGVFIFDKEFNALKEKRGLSAEDNVINILKDKRNRDKTDYVELNLPDESTLFSFEIRKLADSSYFSYNGLLLAPKFIEKELEMSDPVLAQDVSTDEEIKGAIKRKDLYISPKVRKMIGNKEQIYLYYELYDLHKGKDSLTNFEQKLTIMKKKIDDNDGSLAGTISKGLKQLFGDDGSKVSLTSDYKTKEINPQQYLQLDFSGYPLGYYDMLITVRDKNSGKEVERNISFEIYNSKKTK